MSSFVHIGRKTAALVGGVGQWHNCIYFGWVGWITVEVSVGLGVCGIQHEMGMRCMSARLQIKLFFFLFVWIGAQMS